MIFHFEAYQPISFFIDGLITCVYVSKNRVCYSETNCPTGFRQFFLKAIHNIHTKHTTNLYLFCL